MRGALFSLSLALGVAMAGADAAPAAPPAGAAKTVDEVIARNVAARGGLEAWRKVETMVWLGHLESAAQKESQRVPFVAQLKRPNLTRFELKEQFSEFTRVFDGSHGWKVRPGADGRPQTKAFSAEEANFAKSEYVIDGPLIDYRAKGVAVTLDGIDRADDRPAYRLSLTLPGGVERKVWIDVKTNLEIRIDRPATNPLKPGAPVSVYYRDYKPVDGLVLPHVVETGLSRGAAAPESVDRLVIERLMVNPKLDADAFALPASPFRHGNGGKIQVPATNGPSGP